MTTSATSTATDDSILDEEWLAAPRQRSRLRLALVILLSASVCFLGGVQVQKHFGTETSGEGPRGGFAGGGFPGGSGGFPGTLPDGAQAGGVGAGGGAGGAGAEAGSTSTDADRDAVVGTVIAIDGDLWTVEDLGGTQHSIRVTEETSVLSETRLTPDQVEEGDRVDISGTTSDGELQADDVTLR
jgi:hypothetical protein